MNAVTLTIVSQEQNVIDYLNELQMNDTQMDNTIINNSLEHTSGCSKHKQIKNNSNIYFLNLGMKFISHNISIPQISPLINKSKVVIHTFLSVKEIYISVSFNKSEVQKFLKDFSVFCSTCM